MAMFEFKDSEDIKASHCSTTAKTLMKGEGLKRVDVDNCQAGDQSVVPAAPDAPSRWRKIWDWFVEGFAKAPSGIVVAVIVAIVVAVLLPLFGLVGSSPPR